MTASPIAGIGFDTLVRIRVFPRPLPRCLPRRSAAHAAATLAMVFVRIGSRGMHAFQTRVTAVVPTFDRAALLVESVGSLLAQGRPPDRIVVVNDGSTDATVESLARFGERIDLVSKANGGKSSAINLVLPQLREGLVWIFDDDDVALPDALERHLEVFARHPETDFTYSGCIPFRDGSEGDRRYLAE